MKAAWGVGIVLVLLIGFNFLAVVGQPKQVSTPTPYDCTVLCTTVAQIMTVEPVTEQAVDEKFAEAIQNMEFDVSKLVASDTVDCGEDGPAQFRSDIRSKAQKCAIDAFKRGQSFIYKYTWVDPDNSHKDWIVEVSAKAIYYIQTSVYYSQDNLVTSSVAACALPFTGTLDESFRVLDCKDRQVFEIPYGSHFSPYVESPHSLDCRVAGRNFLGSDVVLPTANGVYEILQDMDYDLCMRVDSKAIDCGVASIGLTLAGSNVDATACAVESFKNRKPFLYRSHQSGIDNGSLNWAVETSDSRFYIMNISISGTYEADLTAFECLEPTLENTDVPWFSVNCKDEVVFKKSRLSLSAP